MDCGGCQARNAPRICRGFRAVGHKQKKKWYRLEPASSVCSQRQPRTRRFADSPSLSFDRSFVRSVCLVRSFCEFVLPRCGAREQIASRKLKVKPRRSRRILISVGRAAIHTTTTRVYLEVRVLRPCADAFKCRPDIAYVFAIVHFPRDNGSRTYCGPVLVVNPNT